jgi:hypothetical protein
VFITQIGDTNEASAVQTAPNAYAAITQDGNSNDADVAQTGAGSFYVEASQTGGSEQGGQLLINQTNGGNPH